MSRKALGKGLSALIPDRPVPIAATSADREGICEIPVQDIVPNPHQPRKDFVETGMEDLIRSIQSRGVIQPILVRRGNGGFELIAGERRWRAAKKAGILMIPAIIRKVSDQDSLELALIENLQRENLNSIEAAEAYERLIREFHLTQDEVSRKVGKKRSSVANTLRLLSLPEEVKKYIRMDKLTFGHAKALLSLPGKAKQIAVAREILRKGLSVRKAEELVRNIISGKNHSKSKTRKADIHLQAVEEELKKCLGTRVKLSDRKGRGRIEIEYYSKEERERLISILRNSVKR